MLFLDLAAGQCMICAFDCIVSRSKKRLYRLEALLSGLAIVISPAILHGGGSTPTETANSPYRDAGVGLQLRAQE
jgi:hypothetical protein